eukprot:6422673-Prymnesium_polylepis.1
MRLSAQASPPARRADARTPAAASICKHLRRGGTVRPRAPQPARKRARRLAPRTIGRGLGGEGRAQSKVASTEAGAKPAARLRATARQPCACLEPIHHHTPGCAGTARASPHASRSPVPATP